MRRFVPISLPVGFFLVGLAAGAWISTKRQGTDFGGGTEQRLADNVKANARSKGLLQTNGTSPTDEEILTAVMSALAEDEPLRRAHLLHDAFNRLSPAQLAVFFERAVQLGDPYSRGTLLNALLTRWAALDPDAAAAAVRPFQDRFRAAAQSDWHRIDSAVCQAWAAAMPERALAEAMAAPHRHWARTTAWAAIRSLAEGDPARQLEVLAGLPASRLRGEMCETAIKALAATDSTAAETHLHLLPEPRQRGRVLSEILGKLAERDPAAGLARLVEIAADLKRDTVGIQIVTSVLRAVAAQDASSALAIVDQLPEGLREQALGAALIGWAGDHPLAALTWAAANGVDISEAKSFVFFNDSGNAGWNTLVGTAFERDRAKTLAWVREQPASPARDRMLLTGIWGGTAEEKLQIYAELTPSGQAEAAPRMIDSSFESGEEQGEAWVKTLPAGRARQSAITALTTTQAANTPERLNDIAGAWPPGPERDAAMRGIASLLSRNDPHRALDFARPITGVAAREAALERIAQQWLSKDKPTARAWISAAPELSPEQKRVLLRQADES